MYFQAFIDDFTRMSVIFLMRTKVQTLSNIVRYFAFMRNKGYNVQALRTDQGTEYSSLEIKSYMNMNGIEHAITGRAAHEQMHVAERMNRTITEMARTMLIDAGLPKCWWGHVVKYAITIRNRCTTATFNNEETPYGRFFIERVT